MKLSKTTLVLGTLATIPLLAHCGGVSSFDPTGGASGSGSVLDGLTVLREGSISDQEGPATSGRVAVAEDPSGARFVVLREDFDSDFSTGTVEIFLASSEANLREQSAGNPGSVSPLLGRVNSDGAAVFEIPAGVDDTAFSHIIIWCATVEINFGAASLVEAQGNGGLTTLREGSIVDQEGPATRGTVRIVDDGVTRSVQLLEDFDSDFSTGTVEIYLASSAANLGEQLRGDPSSVSPLLGRVNADGAHIFEIPATVDDAPFTHVIVWCATVEINFGAAPLAAVGPTVLREGSLVDQEGPATGGTVQIIEENGVRSVMLLDNFDSDFSTGTVEIFLASSDANLGQQLAAEPSSVSPLLGRVNQDGAHVFEIPASVDSTQFSHVIVWCATVEINFAAATLTNR